MLLKTILNYVEKKKSFVYKKIQLIENVEATLTAAILDRLTHRA